MHRALARDRAQKGIDTEGWREKHPDHCVIMHDDQALAFVSSLDQALFQIDEAVSQRKHEERLCVFFIHDDPERRKVGQAIQPATQEGFIDVETKIGLIQEKLAAGPRDAVVAELNEVYSEADWQKILYEVVRTGNQALLDSVEGIGLNVSEDHLWMAKKILHDMEKTFPKGGI